MIKIKRRLTFFITLLGLALLLTGCSSKSASDKTTADTTADKTTVTDKTNKQNSDAETVFGKIESIDGSKITIALAQQPERGGKRPDNSGNNSTSTTDSNTASNPPSNQDNGAGNGAPPSGGPGSGGDGQGGPGAGGPPSGNGGGQGPQLQLTGEKQTVTVADDTVIESGRPARSQDNAETSTKLSLSDLKAGMIVQITLKSESTDTDKTAATIRVMSQAGQTQAQQQQQQQ